MEKGIMSTTTKRMPKAAPTTFGALIGELMPSAIYDKAAYGNAMEMVRRLAVVPALNEDQSRYLDTLCVLVAAYEKDHRTVGKAKLKPLEILSLHDKRRSRSAISCKKSD